MLIKFVDACAHVKDVALLCELLDGFVQEMVCKVLSKSKRITLLIMWLLACYICEGIQPCFGPPRATHCIDLILENMGKIVYIKNIVESAKNTTEFIYNHAFVLSLMRKLTNNRKLVHPKITSFATSFISL